MICKVKLTSTFNIKYVNLLIKTFQHNIRHFTTTIFKATVDLTIIKMIFEKTPKNVLKKIKSQNFHL